MNTRDFDQVLGDLQKLDLPQTDIDPQNLAELQASALDKMKKLEFAISKKVDGGDQPLSLSGSDEVPSGFRQMIEEYYRSLAKKQ